MRNAYFHGAVLPVTPDGLLDVDSESESEEVEQARALFFSTDRVLVAGGGMDWLALHLAARCSFVLILEPIPYLHRLLVDNLYVDGSTMIVIRGAIGDTRRQQAFLIDDLWALSRFSEDEAAAQPLVEVYDLRSLVEQAGITGLALDVEGAELKILLSLTADLAQRLRRLLIKFHLFRLPPGSRERLVEHLFSLGYQESSSAEHRSNPRDPQAPDGPHVIVQSFVWGESHA
ncbi:MAG TPA: FkbM family methyltransferase [Anaerolineae bacterium]|nr:FkbM family methyltransferase [Anaerolineae bacterium]